MKRCLFILIVSVVMPGFPVLAKTMFVIDTCKIMVRSQPGETYEIIDQLASDEQVELLETDENWAKIAFKDGKTGWVLERFLMADKPKSQHIADLEKQLQEQAARMMQLEKEILLLQQEKVALDGTLNTLSGENQRLKQEPYQIMLLLSGGGIFLVGSITALILQRVGRRKRGSSLSFEKGIGL